MNPNVPVRPDPRQPDPADQRVRLTHALVKFAARSSAATVAFVVAATLSGTMSTWVAVVVTGQCAVNLGTVAVVGGVLFLRR